MSVKEQRPTLNGSSDSAFMTRALEETQARFKTVTKSKALRNSKIAELAGRSF
jgi:hypothetical protein